MKRMQWLSTVSAVALLLAFAGVSAAFGQATVSTDKMNYQPGEYVLISGAGWAPGETVSLTIYPEGASAPRASYSAMADPAGQIANRDHLVTPADKNTTFRLVANGQQSGLNAQAGFADGPLILSVSAGGQSPYPVVAGNAASYTTSARALKVLGVCTGAIASMSITSALPTGVTYQFNPRQPKSGGSGCAAGSALTIWTSAFTPPGIYSLTVEAANSSTDHATTTITLTVSPENVPPVPEASSLPTITGQCHAEITSTPTAMDNVSGRVWGTTSDPLSYASEGTYTVHWTYTDAAGNKSHQDQVVIVHDSTGPDLTAPPSIVFMTGPGATTCGRLVHASELGEPEFSDNCGGPVRVVPPCAPEGTMCSVGRWDARWQAFDSQGNSSVSTQFITVVDNTPPTLDGMPPDLVVHTGPEATSCKVAVNWLPPTAHDNCAGVRLVASHEPGDLFAVGTTLVTYDAIDAAGNSAHGEFDVRVVDDTPPSIHVPPALHVTTGPDATRCGRWLDDAALGEATADDNCAGGLTLLREGVPDGNVFPLGTTTIQWTATDAAGNRAGGTQDVTVVDDTPPILTCPPNLDVLTDPATCNAVVRYLPEVADNCAGATLECVPPSGSIFPLGTTTVEVTGTDAAGNHSTASFLVRVANPPPEVAIQGPPSATICPVGGVITLAGTFTDNPGDVHTAQWSLDGAPVAGTVNEAAGTVRGSITLRTPGIYKLALTVWDLCGGSGSASTVAGMPAMVVVYDPSAGFVTGGGWIQSPAGAFALDPTRTGKANFGFTSKYRKGAMAPSGETEFQFSAGNLEFHSTSYDWLLVNNAQAQYKGCGTVNGAGAYGFTLTALDGDFAGGGPDRFRIAIKDLATSLLVYDNQPGADDSATPTTSLGGGNIVIHPGASAGGPSLLPQSTLGGGSPVTDGSPLTFGLEPNRPNPFTAATGVRFTLAERGHVRLAVYDITGREVARLVDEDRAAGHYGLEWSGRDAAGTQVRPGVYFCRITVAPTSGSPAFTALRKMVMAK